MIQLSGVRKGYGGEYLFNGVDWLIGPVDRVGLVGANGTGKSTLLKMLCGLETPDDGEVSRAKAATVGYLPQEGLSLAGKTVFDECMGVFSALRDMEVEIETLGHRLSELDPESEAYHQAAERYHEIETEFRTRDGYALEARVSTVLAGLGFSQQDVRRRTEEFSGGWQMRIALAKLLLDEPNLLLLDEPTNHLDLEARNWLEGYLDAYTHSYVLVSHDRYFLDVTVSKTVEIWNHRVHFYTGNYEKYLEEKQGRRGQLEAAQRKQQERREQLEAFINRFRYKATKAKQVQSRIKELEKMEPIELPPEEKAIHFSFPQPKASGRIVAELEDVAKSYGTHEVLRDVRLLIQRGERIALVGVNGAGKSTLMKILAGAEPLSGGEYKLGHNAEPNYFAQDQYRELNQNTTLLDDLAGVAPRWTLTQLRTLLGCFLFRDDDVHKRIGVLSGGERNRYALARLLVSPSNFLLLDEPTNHLDMRAKDVLLEALAKYTGTVVFVSHDRYFIDNLADRVFEVADQHVTAYAGNYEDYMRQKEGLAAAVEETDAEETEPALPELEAPEPPKKRINPIQLAKMQERVAEIEEEAARLEAAVAEAEGELAVFKSAEESQRLATLIGDSRSQLESLLAEWEELSATVSEHAG